MAEGSKVVAAALEAGVAVESVFLAAEGKGTTAVEQLAARAYERGARVFELGPGLMDRVADTVSPQPICAIVPIEDRPLEAVLARPEIQPGSTAAGAARAARALLVCADVRDPGNLGAVLRSAAAAGISAVVCCDGCADPYNPKAVRASAGAIFHVPVVRGGGVEAVLTAVKAAGFRVLGTSSHTGADYLDADLDGDVAVVLGNEASGLGPELATYLDGTLTIPMTAACESLNVAMTATILAFEIARRGRRRRTAKRSGLLP